MLVSLHTVTVLWWPDVTVMQLQAAVDKDEENYENDVERPQNLCECSVIVNLIF